jgi:DNA-binding CsgD family transcriptional regulator
MRFGRGAEYGRAEAAVLEALAPHLCQAVRIMQAFDRSTAVAQSAHATMELQAVPICLVAGDGRVAQQNEAMVRLLASTSALQSIDGRLIATDRRAQAALQVAIAAADGRGIGRGQEQTNRCIALPGSPSGGLIAYVAALPRGSSGLLREGFAVAAIFVCDMSTAAAPPREGFAELFQLTRREMELLTRLLPGYTLPELAHSMGVSLPTVKTHLAHIFGKTGTSRQAELVALAMRATPPIAMP